MRYRRAFTLVEVLVVVAIIAVLIAILTPALQKGRYRARVVVCMNQLRQMCIGTIVYANDHKFYYPDGAWGRPDPATIGWIESAGHGTSGPGDFDLRPSLRKYFGAPLNRVMRCPLSTDFWQGGSFYGDIDHYGMGAFNQVKSPYAFYFGQPCVGGKDRAWARKRPMLKLGDRFIPDQTGLYGTKRFRVLASDFAYYNQWGGSYLATAHRSDTGAAPEGGNFANFNYGALYYGDQRTNANFALDDGSAKTYTFGLNSLDEGTFTGIRSQASATYMIPTEGAE